jgi:hypothetical protein
MTTPRIPRYDARDQVERDPADDSFVEHVRVPGACVCGAQIGEDRLLCAICRYAVVGEIPE